MSLLQKSQVGLHHEGLHSSVVAVVGILLCGVEVLRYQGTDTDTELWLCKGL